MRKAQQGYTLVEALVALSVTAVMMSFLFSALAWSSAALRTADAIEDTTRVSAVHALLRRLLENAYEKYELTEGDERVLSFRGDANIVDFISHAPAEVDIPGLYRIRIEWDEQDHTLFMKRILYRQSTLEASNDQLDAASRYELLSNAKPLELSYFGATSIDSEPTWHQAWPPEAPGNPEMIQLTIQPRDSTKPAVPILIALAHSAQ